jgi:histidine ammonia-lyase
MCAAQGLDFRIPLKAGAGARAAHVKVRKMVEPLLADRVLSRDIEIVARAIEEGVFNGADGD